MGVHLWINGAILTSSKDEQRKLEGNGFISKAISISNDKDSIYFEIGNFYLVNSVKKDILQTYQIIWG